VRRRDIARRRVEREYNLKKEREIETEGDERSMWVRQRERGVGEGVQLKEIFIIMLLYSMDTWQ
jgi:hypothetical protein